MTFRTVTKNVYYEQWLKELPELVGKAAAITGTTSGTVLFLFWRHLLSLFNCFLGILGGYIWNQEKFGFFVAFEPRIDKI